MVAGSEYLFYDRSAGLIVTAAGRTIGHAETITAASDMFQGIFIMQFDGTGNDFERVLDIALVRYNLVLDR